MTRITLEQLQQHIKTHTERSDDDRNAVAVLKTFLRSEGKINENFSCGDKWPNTDGLFELVTNPDITRRPKQNFVVQIKGTNIARRTNDGIVKYQLKSLAFPAYIASEVTLDPGILFVVLNPGKRSQERVFWKYISSQFISSIDFSNKSVVIDFSEDDEIKNTDESINEFVMKLDYIADTHSYIKQLEAREYSRGDILKLVVARCENISEAIETGMLLNYTRDKLSKKILTELEDLCEGTLMLNGLRYSSSTNLRISWELALINIETKFLATFLRGLKYIGLRVPEEGQYERLMLKYYSFLWKIRKYLKEKHDISVLNNLESFPREINDEDEKYNKLLGNSIETVINTKNSIKQSRYYIQKKEAFYVDTERYFEITLQLADKYATKYNRLTVYSKKDISSNYSIQIGYSEAEIFLWGEPSKIKVITDWKVSIEPAVLNKISKILGFDTKLSSKYNEYDALMNFLTQTGINLLDFIDLGGEGFNNLISKIYAKTNTCYFKNILTFMHDNFSKASTILGKNTIRYALIKLREDLLEDLLAENSDAKLKYSPVYISNKCYPFERNPILYNLPKKKTNGKTISRDVFRVIGIKNVQKYLPYIRMKHLINSTGELYYSKDKIEYEDDSQSIIEYNALLSEWDKNEGRELKIENGFVYLEEYVNNTMFILQSLLDFAEVGNIGQQQLNQNFINDIDTTKIDCTKILAIKNIFVDSKVMMIYGAAGTGKTTLMNYISDLMNGRRKLFLAKTHTALENLQRRIKAPGVNSQFIGIDKFIKSNIVSEYDVIFVDECSTIDNKTMVQLLKKINKDALLVLAGDIYQIEAIEFGNWFFYAKEILPMKSIVELNSTWRTNEESLKKLWNEVRYMGDLITEMLVIDGPFSEKIGKGIFKKYDDDEVVLCLNYDGKFGLNSINSYFQDANPSSDVFYWSEWKYKIGDPILFNENKRFPMLYNNLKGIITDIQSDINSITFTINIPILLTEIDIKGYDLSIISHSDKSTFISFSVYKNDESKSDEDYEEARMKSIVPFQLAYAISIHKAQGLEYNSIKLVIPNSNSEKITHGIFYTAITRARERLKIFWEAETMNEIVSSFNCENVDRLSLDIIKNKLSENKTLVLI